MPSVNPTVLRIFDANCNRAREAARVLEDYARFVLNHADLAARLKSLRHDFAAATESLQRSAIAARDTAGDVGTTITTETEQQRESTAAVITAAAKRLGEALRTLEEYSKIIDPVAAAALQAIRYRGYDIERDILLTLSPGRERMRDVVLCVLITEALCRRPWLETASLAIDGGADCLQLREKTLDGATLLARATALAKLCRGRQIISIINDRPDVALLAGADGVHVGQGDLPARQVRQIVGLDYIIGVSTHAVAQARQAVLGRRGLHRRRPGLSPARPNRRTLRSPALRTRETAAAEIIDSRCWRFPASPPPTRPSWQRRACISRAAVSSAVLAADDPASGGGGDSSAALRAK